MIPHGMRCRMKGVRSFGDKRHRRPHLPISAPKSFLPVQRNRSMFVVKTSHEKDQQPHTNAGERPKRGKERRVFSRKRLA